MQCRDDATASAKTALQEEWKQTIKTISSKVYDAWNKSTKAIEIAVSATKKCNEESCEPCETHEETITQYMTQIQEIQTQITELENEW